MRPQGRDRPGFAFRVHMLGSDVGRWTAVDWQKERPKPSMQKPAPIRLELSCRTTISHRISRTLIPCFPNPPFSTSLATFRRKITEIAVTEARASASDFVNSARKSKLGKTNLPHSNSRPINFPARMVCFTQYPGMASAFNSWRSARTAVFPFSATPFSATPLLSNKHSTN